MSIDSSLQQSHLETDSPNSFPRHVAIIMDGNGRWAQEKGLSRLEGHRRGSQTLEDTTKAAAECGLEYLTVYVFSSENWRRPEAEITGLIHLMRYYLQNKIVEFHENGICLKILGDYKAFPKDVVSMIQEAIDLTKNNTGLTLNLALNYGSRGEIVNAVKEISQCVASGKMEIADISEKVVSNFLWTAGTPDPEIFIRTGGEIRVSNYLLWQLSYTELIFVKKYWPDFTKKDLMDAIEEYKRRHRRFGAL